MNKLTKIVATIGPSSEDEKTLRSLLKEGVNVFRFNLKHNELNWHEATIDKVKRIAADEKKAVGILIDLQGPEIRIFLPTLEKEITEGGQYTVGEEGSDFIITNPEVLPYLQNGQKVLLDDGKFSLMVIENRGYQVVLVSESSGLLKNRKTLNVPGANFPLSVLHTRDFQALEMAREIGVDYIALSFVRMGSDVRALKEAMQERNIRAKTVAKIETALACEHIDEVIEASDGVMVARGDLGIELPYEEVPYYQKKIIKKCIERGIPVITATQMLESMIEHPYATRAEISDVANAVYDFTDAVMLSGETAYGKYPEKSVETMRKTVSFIESKHSVDTRAEFDFQVLDQEEMICDASYNLFLQMKARHDRVGGFIVFTHGGRTAEKLSRYRARVPIYAFTPTEPIANELTLSYGVIPFVQPEVYREGEEITGDHIINALDYLVMRGLITNTKYYIVLHGDLWMKEGKTSTIKVVEPAGE